MPVFIAMLWGGFLSLVSSLVGRVLVSLGIGYFAYQGIDVLIGHYKDVFVTAAGSLDPRIVGMLGVFKIGTGLNILMSAIIARMTLSGMTGGTIKRMGVK
jgi:hypothetical protein